MCCGVGLRTSNYTRFVGAVRGLGKGEERDRLGLKARVSGKQTSLGGRGSRNEVQARCPRHGQWYLRIWTSCCYE